MEDVGEMSALHLEITADEMHGRVLIALRAGALDSRQIEARLGDRGLSAANRLCKKGLMHKKIIDGACVFTITQDGAACCPSRRDASRIVPEGKGPSRGRPGKAWTVAEDDLLRQCVSARTTLDSA